MHDLTAGGTSPDQENGLGPGGTYRVSHKGNCNYLKAVFVTPSSSVFLNDKGRPADTVRQELWSRCSVTAAFIVKRRTTRPSLILRASEVVEVPVLCM